MAALDVSNLPVGLASLLNLQQRGQGPQYLSDIISPVIDVTQYLLANNYQIARSGSTPIVIGGMNLVVVPGGELWFVHQLGIVLDPGPVPVGGALRIAPTFSVAAGVALSLAAPFQSFAAGEIPSVGVPINKLLASGAVIGVSVAAVTGAMSVALAATITRMRV